MIDHKCGGCLALLMQDVQGRKCVVLRCLHPQAGHYYGRVIEVAPAHNAEHWALYLTSPDWCPEREENKKETPTD